MFTAFGWAKIQSSQDGYQKLDPLSDEVDDLDSALEATDRILFHDLSTWLKNRQGLKWQFTEYLNYDSGFLQFHSASNHRGNAVWELIDFIRLQSSGSYGVVYIHDDEDDGRRTGQDLTGSFRVWRILDGELTEHEDPLFSPFTSQNAFGGSGSI